MRVFVMGDAASCAKSGQQTPGGYYNIERMLRSVAKRQGEIGVCGTCMAARGIEPDELVEGARRSTKEFFATRARRKALCEVCLKFAIGVLVFSAFLGFEA